MEKQESIEKDLFQDIPIELRAQMLQDNSYGHELTTVTRRYSESKIKELKEELSEASVQLSELAGEKAEITKQLDAQMKPLKLKVSESTKGLRERSYTNNEEVYLMDDQTNGVMDIYDSEGKFLYSRRLYENERQHKMFTLDAKAV